MPTNTVVGSARAIFTISLVAAATEEVRVDWATKDGTAIAGRDYETNSGTVAFAPGETSKTVEIFVHGRTVETEDRVFYVLLDPPVNALLADEIGACVIHVDTTGTLPVVTVIIPRGEKGLTGDSAYQIALNDGFVGTESEWLASLRPSPAEIAPLVAPLINAGDMTVTAAGTEAKPDTAAVKEFMGRIAYMRRTKKAFAPPLTAGVNVVPVTAFVGDAFDASRAVGFNVAVLRGGVLHAVTWEYLSETAELKITGGVAGDIPVAVEQDIGSAADLVRHPSINAITQRFLMEVAAGSFIYKGNYSAGIEITSHKDYFKRDELYYYAISSLVLPYTTTGNWGVEGAQFIPLGDDILRQQLSESADLVGDRGGSTVQAFIDLFRSKTYRDVVTVAAKIPAAIAAGGRVVIASGGYYMLPEFGAAVCDYAAPPEVGFAGHGSKRFDISGETPGGTILSNQHGDYAIKLLGSYPVTQNFGGFDRIGNLTIVGVSVTTPNTDNSGGAGLFVQTKAYTQIYSYTALNLSLGLHLDGVLSSTVEDVTIEGCFEGLRVNDTNTTSGPNGMHFRRIKIGGSTSIGARIELGASTNFDNFTIEGCGTMGGISVASLWQSKIGSIGVNVNLTTPYFELNAGPADIYISHVATQPMVFSVNGGIFHRTTAVRYVDTHFLLRSEPGAGNVTVKLNAVTFLHSFGYVPDAGRPLWDVGPKCEIIWDEACVFSEEIKYWLCLDRPYRFSVAANGTILNGPAGFGCTALGAGKYRFFRTAGQADFSKFATDLSIQLTARAPGYTPYVLLETPSTIEIQTYAGVSIGDAAFDIEITRTKGYYA